MLLAISPITHVLVIFVSAFHVINASYLLSPATPASMITHCGSSVEEARSLGCRFDIMSFAYHPPACWDPELSGAFVSQYRQKWEWTTMDYTPLSVDEVLEGNHTALRANPDFHSYHCIYEWQRLLRAVAAHRPLDVKLANAAHAHHCSRGLLQEGHKDVADGGEQSLQLLMFFSRCGLTAHQKQDLSSFNRM